MKNTLLFLKDAWLAVWWFATGLLRNLKIGFFSVFGHIKVYRWPLFIVYDPKGYDVTAVGIRRALELVKKGDVLVRRYRNFLDGYFIPGRFSHSGLYVGDGIVIHAMGDGVQKIDILDFLRCDGFAILRPVPWMKEDDRNALVHAVCKTAHDYIGCKYDYDFDLSDEDMCLQSEDGKPVRHSKSVYCHELVRKCYSALRIPALKPSLWNGMIRSSKCQILAQSFFDSPDFSVVYDSDFSEPRCSVK